MGMAPQNDFGLVWLLFFCCLFAEAYGGKQDESGKMSSIMARHPHGFVGNQFLSSVMKLRVTLLHCRLPQHQSRDKTLGDNQPCPAAGRQTRSGLPDYRSSPSLRAHGPGSRQHPPRRPVNASGSPGRAARVMKRWEGGAASTDGGARGRRGGWRLSPCGEERGNAAGGQVGAAGDREGGEKGKGMGKGRAAAPRPRRTHPEDEGVDDEEGFQTRYDGFGLHSPRCHNTELPAAGWAREEEKGGGGGGEREEAEAAGGELSARLAPPCGCSPQRPAGPRHTARGRAATHGPGDGPEAENVSRRHCPQRGDELRAEPEGAGLPQLSP